MMGLREILADPNIAGVNVDSPDRISQHRELLMKKRMIREVFFELYDLMSNVEKNHFDAQEGHRIEIGAGSSLLKKAMPDVEITDIVPFDGLDRQVDAQAMPYSDGSIKTIFGIHCFHHLPNPYRFLSEVRRVCRSGGGTVLIDPYYGPVATQIYKRLFTNEHFDKAGPAVVENHGPMSDANQALSYIVFKRERAFFDREFPELEIVEMKPIKNFVRYLASGGVNFRQLLPDIAIPALRVFENVLLPVNQTIALHHIIVIRKK